MANTFVQATADTANQVTATPVLAYSSNVAVGNVLVVGWKRDSTGTLNTVSDNMGVGNVWSAINDTTFASNKGGLAWAISKGSGACTVSLGLSVSNTVEMALGEWHGPNAFRAGIGAGTGGSGTATTLAFTPAVGDLLVGMFSNNGGATSATAGGTQGVWTKRTQATVGGTAIWLAMSDNLNAVASSQTASMTWNTTFTVYASGGIFFFNPSLVGGGWVNRHRSFITKR